MYSICCFLYFLRRILKLTKACEAGLLYRRSMQSIRELLTPSWTDRKPNAHQLGNHSGGAVAAGGSWNNMSVLARERMIRSMFNLYTFNLNSYNQFVYVPMLLSVIAQLIRRNSNSVDVGDNLMRKTLLLHALQTRDPRPFLPEFVLPVVFKALTPNDYLMLKTVDMYAAVIKCCVCRTDMFGG